MNNIDRPAPALAGPAAAWANSTHGLDALDAQLLLAKLLGKTRGWLIAHEDHVLAPAVRAQYGEWVVRRAAGEPLAYITGEREFWSLPLAVTRDVLVPRPETELVVERALALLATGDGTATDSPVRVADLGTGSGAIALALAQERPRWQVVATDASAAALGVAQGNAQRLGVGNVQFRQGNWCEPLANERYQLIASNPPYIAAGDTVLDDPALRYEPASALASGPDGLDDIRQLIAAAPAHLHPGGWLVLEHGAAQGEAVCALFVAQGWAQVRCHADLAGRPRVSEARRG
jgi:release factor glutamine methyltransferase